MLGIFHARRLKADYMTCGWQQSARNGVMRTALIVHSRPSNPLPFDVECTADDMCGRRNDRNGGYMCRCVCQSVVGKNHLLGQGVVKHTQRLRLGAALKHAMNRSDKQHKRKTHRQSAGHVGETQYM